MTRLTYAPLPEWKHLFKAIYSGEISDTELAQPWKQGDEKAFWFSRSAWSLYTIAEFRRRATGKLCLEVWLPDYFCNAALAPLRSLDVKLFFYPVLEDGKPDLGACSLMLKESCPDLLIVVHYFGFPTPTHELASFAQKWGAWLIEDSAHVLRPESGMGKCSDFVLYSPHKFLATPDGALLLIRTNGPGNLRENILKQFDFYGLYEQLLWKSNFLRTHVLLWLTKRVLQKIGVRAKYRVEEFYDEKSSMNANAYSYPHMSVLAKRLLVVMQNTLEKEEVLRKKNHAKWCEILTKEPALKDLFMPLSKAITPYLAGFIFTEETCACKTYQAMKKAKLPVSTWPDLPPEVLKDKERHKNAISLRKTRLFLPVHGSINSKMIESSFDLTGRL